MLWDERIGKDEEGKERRKMNCGQIGEPGSGKTFNLQTIIPFAEKTGSKFAIIDADAKLKNSPLFRGAEKRGAVEIIEIGSRQISGQTLRQAVERMKNPPTQQPEGYLKIVDAIDNLKIHADKYCAIALDTLTIAQDHLRKLLMQASGKTQFEYPEWTMMLRNLELLFTDFYDVDVPLKIINMHLQWDKIEQTGEVKIFPLVEGSFRGKAGNYLSEFYRTEVKLIQGQPKYIWRVRPDGRFMARSEVFTSLEVDQDWKPVWSLL